MKITHPSHLRRPLCWFKATAALSLFLFPCILAAQEINPADPGGELVEVNWLGELGEGGLTMVALGMISVAMLVFIAERAIRLRRSRLAPSNQIRTVTRLVSAGDFDGALAQCRTARSVFSDVAEVVLSHRTSDPQITIGVAGDMIGRATEKELERAYPLAIVASIAPLLGLLGTMIGMIEAFKLVEVFGDEGGASLLAGSISKALITTAVGLILAIPAIAAYHIFRHRANLFGEELEVGIDGLCRECFLTTAPPAGTQEIMGSSAVEPAIPENPATP